jgi:hypothetical protein
MICKIYTDTFAIKYKSKNYLVALHHNLPIERVTDDDNNELEIIINSNWNQLLFLKLPDNYEKKSIIDNFDKKLPDNSEATINKDINVMITGIKYIAYDNLFGYKLPYILCSYNGNNNITGLPVFINNKLIGVYCRTDKSTSTGYIIPIYIIVKSLDKNDNKNIYTIPDMDKIKK